MTIAEEEPLETQGEKSGGNQLTENSNGGDYIEAESNVVRNSENAVESKKQKPKSEKKPKSERKHTRSSKYGLKDNGDLSVQEKEEIWDEEDDDDDEDSNITALDNLEIVSWFHQFYYVSKKNLLLLKRRPFMVTIYLFSSVLSVILAWLVVRENDDKRIIEEFDECGTVPYPIVDRYEMAYRTSDYYSYSDNTYTTIINDDEERPPNPQDIQFSLNEQWRNGFAITLMALGPMINAILVVFVLHGEISSQLLGMLRTLGVRDSVYWCSWYLPFLVMSLVNSLLGAVTTQILPNVHAFGAVYFGGIFSSLLFLQLPLIASSCFVAVVMGTAKRALNWIILLLLVAIWIPFMIQFFNSDSYMYHWSTLDDGVDYTPGVFWQYANTFDYQKTFDYNGIPSNPDLVYDEIENVCESEVAIEGVNFTSLEEEVRDCLNGSQADEANNCYSSNDFYECEQKRQKDCGNKILANLNLTSGNDDLSYQDLLDSWYECQWNYETEMRKNANITWSTCNRPIVSEDQGTWFKSYNERAEMTSDELFVGCFSKASWSTSIWSTGGNAKEGWALFGLYMFPYFHFTSVWGNFLGYTQLPDRDFDGSLIYLSPEELSLEGLPLSPPDAAIGLTTNLFPQGSTVKRNKMPRYGDSRSYYELNEDSTCPMPNSMVGTSANLCDYVQRQRTCPYAEDPAPTESKSVSQLYGHLIALTVIYLLAAAYWAQVFTTGNGKRQSYFFFVSPSYWRFLDQMNPSKSDCKNKERLSVEDIVNWWTRDDGVGQEQYNSSTSNEGGIVIESIRKLYGSFEAIKGVSLKMARGEVTALLGHNGAGKTTLSQILCCEIPPSEGDAYIFGHSVTQDPFSIRNLVGLCKQDDYLWPDLSAREHLELYGGLRGVKKSKLHDVVQQWLESVDLADVQLQQSAAFSGGMKRRLSLALATIGDRPLIILDEPTTGMDPVSRRFVWRHIDKIKKDRVILLTTHAMEEADLLADEVAIMRKGELAAFGTPLELKTEYGSALQFSILVKKNKVEAAKKKMIEKFFISSLEWVEFEFGESGNITLNIRKIRQDGDIDGVKVELLSKFVAWLESNESMVKEYGVSNSTLEEVFLKVTEVDDEENEPNDAKNRNCCSCCLSCCGRSKTAEEIDNERKAEEDALNRTVEADNVDNTDKIDALASFFPKLTVLNQIVVLLRDCFERSWTGRGSIINYIIYGLMWIGTIILAWATAQYFSGIGQVFILPVVALSLLLVATISPIYFDRNEGLLYLMRTQGLLAESHLLATGLYSFLIQLLYGFLVLTSLYLTPLFRSPFLCDSGKRDELGYPFPGPDADQEACKTWYAPFQREAIKNPEIITNIDFGDADISLIAVREPGGYGMILGAIFCFALTFPGAVWCTSHIPGYKFPLFSISFITLLLGLLPVFYYGTGGFTFDWSDMAQKLSECKKITDPNNVCNDDFAFKASDVNGDFVNCAAYGDLYDYELYPFCSPTYTALLPQFGLYQMLMMAYQAKVQFISEPSEWVDEVLIPALKSNGVRCSGAVCNVPRTNTIYGMNILYMLIGSLLLLLLGVLLASSFGFPMAIVLRLRKRIAFTLELFRFHNHDEGTSAEVDTKGSEEEELPEVGKERRKVQQMLRPYLDKGLEGITIDLQSLPRDEIAPVVGLGLRKVYPGRGRQPPKVALKSMNLHVPKGQVLGFLGKNGAGKTTALKILAGDHDASEGIGLVAGYDCGTERIPVFERLGNCPQFDVVWKFRTVRSHLEFLAGLKGVPRQQRTSVAHSIATAVGLGSPAFYQRKAGELSGGMRRRLSIAMSLIGSPAVLILDEPTTGLDPSTRSSIWALVNSFARNDRSTIITTHMMVEADTLCNRIAIIADGELKVVGSQQHLKNKFGSGYLLQLNMIKSNKKSVKKAMKFVKKHLHPKAVLTTKQAKTLHVNLPREGLDLKKVFMALYSPEASSRGCINQFLLSQSSLEDVFVALGD